MNNKILQLKIRLLESKPSIWRRFVVKDNITFHQLHEIIQIVMGWGNYHLYEFMIGNLSITDEETVKESFYGNALDSAKTKLNEFIDTEKQKMKYIYDFGDSWEHNITVEKILPDDEKLNYPVCLAGKNACPPEDCGGINGYYEFLEVIQNPEHPKHKSMLKWIGGKFNPEKFDLESVNQKLKTIKM
jgi:hypothetical protein